MKSLILIFIVLIMIYSINEGIIQINDYYHKISDNRYIFDEQEQKAAQYLKNHVNRNEVIVADHQKTKDTGWIRAFSMKQTIVLPSTIYIEMTPPPFDKPFKTLKSILDEPNENNVMDGLQYNFTYYFFGKTYHRKQIEMFNQLPYFLKVYENPEIIIYKIDVLKLESITNAGENDG